MQLKYKISISIFVIALVIVSSISFIYSQLSYKNIIQNEKTNLAISAIESARYIEVELLERLSNTLTISSAPIVQEMLNKSNLEYTKLSDKQRLEKINKLNKKWMEAIDENDSFVMPYLHNKLALFLKKQQNILKGVYGELFITNKYGTMIASTGKLTTLAHSHKYWWKESFSNGDGAIFFDDRGFDASVRGYVIGVTVPIKQDGEIIGILKANVNIISTLKEIVNHYNSMKHGELKIVRTKGLIVYEDSLAPLSTRINPQVIKYLKQSQSGTIIVNQNNKKSLISYAPLRLSLDNKNIGFGGKIKTLGSYKGNDRENWHAVIVYPKELVLSKSIQTNNMIIYIGLILSFLSAFVAFLTARWISQPIEELQQAQLKLQEQEEIIISQSQHAAMGEMISMIAHQWRQPLSVISMDANNILADIELDLLDNQSLKNSVNNINNQTQELSKIIDDFKNFFRPNKIEDEIVIDDIIHEVIKMIGKSLEYHDINIEVKSYSSKKIKTYSRELMQVFINIINNAKEAIIINNMQIKYINIVIESKDNKMYIKICDSGGGISADLIDKIFNPYFSTKDKKNGTGLGLYMSKTIIEKHLNGIIKVYNKDKGACFEIQLPYELI